MHQKLFQTIQKHNLIPAHTLVIVAVSGGMDSLALLHALNALRPRLACHLHVATLDHGLRGAAGAADTRFVADTATSWGLPVTVDTVDVPALMAETGQGVESAARQSRYTFLARVAHVTGAAVVATAHHADDQAETILLHLLRGAGLRGLRGMARHAPLPGYPEIALIRPLLDISRGEIEVYCREHGLAARQDETNQDTSLIRNRIRHDILPQLQAVNPQVVAACLHLAESAAVDQDYLAEQFAPVMTTSIRGNDRITLNRADFAALHPALQRRFIVWAAEQFAGSETISHDHVTAAAAMGCQGPVGGQILLPGALRLRVDYAVIAVERLAADLPDADQPLLPSGATLPVAVPGMTPLPGGVWVLATTAARPPDAELRRWAVLPGGGILALRTRRDGDRFAPPGLNGHTTKLNRWLAGRKVPSYLRDQIPLLTIQNEIAAVALAEGWVISADFTLRESAKETVYIGFLTEH